MASRDQANTRDGHVGRTGHAGVRLPRTDGWAVFGRALGYGTRWGAIFGALTGLPFYGIGALIGAPIGAAVGLVGALTPGWLLVAYAVELRQDLRWARCVAGMAAAGPFLALLLWFGWGAGFFVTACAIAAGTTAALFGPRILNGHRVAGGAQVLA